MRRPRARAVATGTHPGTSRPAARAAAPPTSACRRVCATSVAGCSAAALGWHGRPRGVPAQDTATVLLPHTVVTGGVETCTDCAHHACASSTSLRRRPADSTHVNGESTVAVDASAVLHIKQRCTSSAPLARTFRSLPPSALNLTLTVPRELPSASPWWSVNWELGRRILKNLGPSQFADTGCRANHLRPARPAGHPLSPDQSTAKLLKQHTPQL